jgi:DNA adenine methylase
MIGYIGGKLRLAHRLIAMFPPHVAYVEPFSGMAKVLFSKPRSKVEVLNDRNDEVVTFLRVCQLHHEELLRYLRYVIASRSLFDLYSRQDPRCLTDIQRAARFLYLQKTAYGGMVVARSYAPPRRTKSSPFNPETLPQLLEDVARRLARVQLECLSYQDVLRGYDRETTFFYCDPPYVGAKLYAYNFSEADFRELAEQLGNLKGKFLLSLNDHPLAREIFGRFFCREVYVAYTASRSSRRIARELVFSNYELRRQLPCAVDSSAEPTEPVRSAA